MKKFFSISISLLVVCLVAVASARTKSSGYHIVDTIAVGGAAKWDYCSIEPVSRRLFVSHGSSVAVIDLASRKLVKEFTGLKGTHGIAFAPKAGRGYITDGGANSVIVFDIASLDVVAKTPVGEKPDAIMYDDASEKIFCANGGSKSLSVIDPATNAVIGTVALQGQPEFGTSDGKGRLYVNLEDESAINVVDTKMLAVVAKWPLAPCGGPTGMAIDRDHKRIFTGGRNKVLAVVNATTGKIVATVPIGAGVDACAYDSKMKLVFASCKDGTITVIEQKAPDKYIVVENAVTRPGSKTMALDPTDHHIYLPANTAPDATDKTKGTLCVLVLER